MAYNVLAKRRFFVPDKKTAKQFTGTKNFGGVKPHKGRSSA